MSYTPLPSLIRIILSTRSSLGPMICLRMTPTPTTPTPKNSPSSKRYKRQVKSGTTHFHLSRPCKPDRKFSLSAPQVLKPRKKQASSAVSKRLESQPLSLTTLLNQSRTPCQVSGSWVNCLDSNSALKNSSSSTKAKSRMSPTRWNAQSLRNNAFFYGAPQATLTVAKLLKSLTSQKLSRQQEARI